MKPMPAPKTRFQLLYRDDDFVVAAKDSGLSAQDGERAGQNIVDLLEESLGTRPFPAHRLDRDTAGIMLFGLSSGACARAQEALRSKGAEKRYKAICFGDPAANEGLIDRELGDGARARAAETRWKVERRFGGLCLIECALGTGRMHQIRRHLAMEGMPIVADDKHGDFKRNREARAALGARKLMLAAVLLVVPGVGPGRFDAPLPPHMADLLARLEGGARGG
jgi:23S rRNA pseudouridine955/2504/2580 synthase